VKRFSTVIAMDVGAVSFCYLI